MSIRCTICGGLLYGCAEHTADFFCGGHTSTTTAPILQNQFTNMENKTGYTWNEVAEFERKAYDKGFAEGQSSHLRWVKASERLPGKRHNYHVKMQTSPRASHHYVYNTTCLFDGEKFVDDVNRRELYEGQTVVEWLEQTQSTDQEEGLNDLLDDLEAYFDDRADAEVDDEKFIPNREMKLLVEIRKFKKN